MEQTLVLQKTNLPTIAELFSDNIELAYKGEQMNLLLNKEPKPEWVKVHPFISNYKYLPIDKIEFLLRMIFKTYKIEITGQGTAFNGVWVTVRVHYFNVALNEMSFHDGIGACQLQTAKGTSPADLININNGALSMAFPIAKTVAIKDACDHFGKLFGSDLNRKDTIPFVEDKVLLMTDSSQDIDNEILGEIEQAINLDALTELVLKYPQLNNNKNFLKAINNKRATLR